MLPDDIGLLPPMGQLMQIDGFVQDIFREYESPTSFSDFSFELANLYKALGRPVPSNIIWTPNPQMGCLAAETEIEEEGQLLTNEIYNRLHFATPVSPILESLYIDQVRNKLYSKFEDPTLKILEESDLGAFPVTWNNPIAQALLPRAVLVYIQSIVDDGKTYEDLADPFINFSLSVGWWWPFEKSIVVSKRPVLRDSEKIVFSDSVRILLNGSAEKTPKIEGAIDAGRFAGLETFWRQK